MNKIVDSKPFQIVVFTVITLNAVILGLETVPAVQESYGSVLKLIDNACLCVFVVEMVMRIVAQRSHFFKSGWNWFDMAVIAVSLVPSACNLSSLRVVRLLRQIRTLRLVTRLRTMQIVVNAIFRSLPSLAHAILLMIVLLYIYAIIGVNLYGELISFSNLGSAMLTLVVTTTFEGWGDLMQTTMEHHPFAWIYFISFVIISALIMLNIVVGIVVSFVQEAYEKEHTTMKKCFDKSASDYEEIERHINELQKLIQKQKGV